MNSECDIKKNFVPFLYVEGSSSINLNIFILYPPSSTAGNITTFREHSLVWVIALNKLKRNKGPTSSFPFFISLIFISGQLFLLVDT